MRKRGVTDFSLAMIDPWAAGYDIEDPLGRRLLRPLTFVRSREDDNGYARPVEGLIVLVDLDLMEVVDVRDHGVVPLPEKAGNYMPELMVDDDNRPAHTAVRDDLRPIEITQPEGPELHRRRARGELAEVAAPGGLQPARGARAAPGRLRGPGPGAPGALPRLAVGDVHPLRRPGADPPDQERVRRGRVRASACCSTRCSWAATAWARSTTSTPSPTTRTASRSPSPTPSACTRRTSASAGSTPTSAPRRWRSAAPAGWWSLASPPSATTSTASSGTSTPTAPSSSRSS